MRHVERHPLTSKRVRPFPLAQSGRGQIAFGASTHKHSGPSAKRKAGCPAWLITIAVVLQTTLHLPRTTALAVWLFCTPQRYCENSRLKGCHGDEKGRRSPQT